MSKSSKNRLRMNVKKYYSWLRLRYPRLRRAVFCRRCRTGGYHVLFATALMVSLCGCGRVDVDTRLREAAAAASKGYWQLAVEMTEECAAEAPNNLTAAVLHGLCLLEVRQEDEALDVLSHATELAPDEFLPHYFYGWALTRTGAYGDALEPLRRAYELRRAYPDVIPDVLILLSRCCLEQRLAKGMGYLQALRMYRAYRQSPEVYNSLGLLWTYELEYENARENFLKALERAPENAVVLQNMAVLHDAYLDEPDSARRYYMYSLKARQVAGDSGRQTKIRRRLRQLARQTRDADTAGGGVN